MGGGCTYDHSIQVGMVCVFGGGELNGESPSNHAIRPAKTNKRTIKTGSINRS